MDEHELLAGYPPPQHLADEQLAAAVADGRRVVVLDDDPTGTQTVAGVPVITAWAEDDVRWAMRQETPGFYVLTNTRSLSADAAAQRNQEVLEAVMAAATAERIEITLVSRGDSTLRGHFPLETDVLTAGLGAHGIAVDGTVLIPAFVDAGRITVGSTHWVTTPAGLVPAGETEFAQDPEFGYAASTLQDYVAEKSRGRWPSEQVRRITLDRLRADTPEGIASELGKLRAGQPAVVDAATDEDVRMIALAAIEAERRGMNLLYRTGPSFVRSRLGQNRNPPVSDADLRTLLAVTGCGGGNTGQQASPHGLVVAGSYVGLTTSQLEVLVAAGEIRQFTLDVAELRSGHGREQSIDSLAITVADALASGDVVLATSRVRLTGAGEDASRAIQAEVSDALVQVVRRVIARRRPRWLLAKGGITSSDIATESLGIRRAWVRGTLLPGIVSLWVPANRTAQRIPYVVFAGNVGDAESLKAVVTRLRGS